MKEENIGGWGVYHVIYNRDIYMYTYIHVM